MKLGSSPSPVLRDVQKTLVHKMRLEKGSAVHCLVRLPRRLLDQAFPDILGPQIRYGELVLAEIESAELGKNVTWVARQTGACGSFLIDERQDEEGDFVEIAIDRQECLDPIYIFEDVQIGRDQLSVLDFPVIAQAFRLSSLPSQSGVSLMACTKSSGTDTGAGRVSVMAGLIVCAAIATAAAAVRARRERLRNMVVSSSHKP
jgi:hypothetical protein